MSELRSSELRARLGHPVIDGDGHVIEQIPVFADFVRDHGRSDIVERSALFGMTATYAAGQRALTTEDRRRAAMVPARWTTPTDTDYYATITTPALYHERIAEAGIDFAVLYPTVGLPLLQIDADEDRAPICRFFNEFMADQYRPYGDRFTLAAAIPMHTPEEAIAALEHARSIGAKVGLIPSYVRRPRPGESWAQDDWERARPSGFGFRGWLDTFGLDSAHDYDPVWSKAIELGMPLAVHSPGMGFSDRQSPTNFSYNGVGHFAAAGVGLAKSLFFGGVLRRFPRLRVAVLEGGVAVGVETYVRLVGFWKKRGTPGIDRLSPANIDRSRLAALYAEHEPARREVPGRPAGGRPRQRRRPLRRLRRRRHHLGRGHPRPVLPCVHLGLRGRRSAGRPGVRRPAHPAGAHLPAIMGSDIGHWDVPDFDVAPRRGLRAGRRRDPRSRPAPRLPLRQLGRALRVVESRLLRRYEHRGRSRDGARIAARRRERHDMTANPTYAPFAPPQGPWLDLGPAPRHKPVHTAIARALFHRVVPTLEVRASSPTAGWSAAAVPTRR